MLLYNLFHEYFLIPFLLSASGNSLAGHTIIGTKFSTYDKDNDVRSTENCAATRGGGWWYHNCAITSLTSDNPGSADPYEWRHNIGHLAASFVMIRP